jgi:hypothetical protein
LEITRREGTRFEASWYEEFSRWDIQGTIDDGRISWKAEDVRVIKGRIPGFDTTGTLDGEKITLDYSGPVLDGVQHSTTVELHLSR